MRDFGFVLALGREEKTRRQLWRRRSKGRGGHTWLMGEQGEFGMFVSIWVDQCKLYVK